MPESLLSVQLSEIAGRVAHYLGFGRTPAAWTGWNALTPYVVDPLYTPAGSSIPLPDDSRLAWIMECVQAGYRRFLYPKLVDEGPVVYQWSFLTPERQLNLVANVVTYDMPDDFADLLGELTFQPGDNYWQQIEEVGIGQVVRKLQENPGLTTFPNICAVYPKQSDGASGQRFAIRFAPIPDRNYVLDYRSTVIPGPLSQAAPFPYGGAPHGETIVQSCLAVAEERFMHDANEPHKKDFEERLRASIALDREKRPEFYGKCADHSDNFDVATPPYAGYSSVALATLHNGQPW